MTLKEAKEKVAVKHGYDNWIQIEGEEIEGKLFDEAAELYARSKCLELKGWYDKLTPADKCTLWPPVGSGSGHGLYNQSDQDIVEKFFKL